jgi:hypothetical protein
MKKKLAWGMLSTPFPPVPPPQGPKAEAFFLFPGEQVTVPVGGKVNLHTMQMNLGTDVQVVNAEWTLNGKSRPQANAAEAPEGRLEHALFSGSALYYAPGRVPSRNPVMVTVAFQLSDKEKTKLYLSCAITVTEVENYFSVSSPFCCDYFEYVKPATEFARQHMSAVDIRNGRLHVNVNGVWARDLNVPLQLSVVISEPPGEGTYPWSPDTANKANISAGNYMGQHISLASADYVPHYRKTCELVPVSGATTITAYDTAKNILQGYYSGVVLGMRQDQHYYGSVYGRFTAHLQ